MGDSMGDALPESPSPLTWDTKGLTSLRPGPTSGHSRDQISTRLLFMESLVFDFFPSVVSLGAHL